MSKTLGDVINAALKTIREPEVTAFTATNILQQQLIEAANNAVREVMLRTRFRWGLSRAVFQTDADLTSGGAAVTNGSTTITCKDADGVDAATWTGIAAGWYFRDTANRQSYRLTAVDTGSTPHTATLETAYVGTTSSTGISYVLLHDEYGLSTSDLRTIVQAQCTSNAVWTPAAYAEGKGGLGLWALEDLMQAAHSDPHLNTSGVPKALVAIGVDDSVQPRYKLWPYPGEDLVCELWYYKKFTEQSTFAATLFGAGAPADAEDAVEYACCARANLFDRQGGVVEYFESKKAASLAQLVREGADLMPNQARVATFRRYAHGGVRVESQTAFDTRTGNFR